MDCLKIFMTEENEIICMHSDETTHNQQSLTYLNIGSVTKTIFFYVGILSVLYHVTDNIAYFMYVYYYTIIPVSVDEFIL